MTNKITSFLWFNNNAEEALNFYVSLFPNSKIESIAKYPDSMPDMAGKVLTAIFNLDGQEFIALDGGPQFPHTEAFSMFVDCENQEEVDRLWTAFISNGGEESQCGWLKDKFGLSWQIIPKQLGEFMSNPDPVKSGKAMQAMLKMHKIDIAELERAANE